MRVSIRGGAARGPLDREGVFGAHAADREQVADLADQVDRFAVDGHDHIVDLEHLAGGGVRRDLADDRARGPDGDRVAEPLEGHRDGDGLRGVHELGVVTTVLFARSTSEEGVARYTSMSLSSQPWKASNKLKRVWRTDTVVKATDCTGG